MEEAAALRRASDARQLENAALPCANPSTQVNGWFSWLRNIFAFTYRQFWSIRQKLVKNDPRHSFVPNWEVNEWRFGGLHFPCRKTQALTTNWRHYFLLVEKTYFWGFKTRNADCIIVCSGISGVSIHSVVRNKKIKKRNVDGMYR